MNLKFLINRLFRMSPPEIVYRVGQKVQTGVERTLKDLYVFDTTVTEGTQKLFGSPIIFNDYKDLIRKADDLCENRFDIFALKQYQIKGKINYHLDYKSGYSAPRDIFGKNIDYRASDKIGDIKYIWELSRQLYLVPLALAYKFTKQAKYKDKFEDLLLEWITQNPFMLGVNWASSLELGIRLINWTICWHIIGDDINSELKTKWLDSVYRHCWFINRNLSAFSSANNHLLGEVAGLYIGSVGMPQFKASRKWTEKSYKVILRETQKQNYSDGVNKEQAISYQQFVLDFLILSGLTGEANNIKFPSDYWVVVENMLIYLAAIEDVNGNLPHIGDEDDGYVVDIMQKETGVYRSLLNTGAYLFKREEFLKDTGKIDNKALLLLNIGNIHIEEVNLTENQLPDSFKAGGYYILGTDFHTPKEQKLIFDCGNLGYLSLAAHGHADALSIYFSAGGYPIFVDPGTFAYHGDKKWRNYFRSTLAHNTARIDGKDQSLMAGNFMWGSKANARLIEYKPLGMAKGAQDGYKSLNDSVLHERKVDYLQDSREWRIEDFLNCEGKHSLELFFHIHPDCKVEVEEKEVKIHFSKGYCIFEKEEGIELKVYKGDEVIPLGWYSPSYGVKVPAPVLRLYKEINGSTKVVTKFTIMFDEPIMVETMSKQIKL